jgi:hypothetical protein
MGSRKLDKSAFHPVVIDSRQTHLTLPPEAVRFRKSGIEFNSPVPLNPWVEMTVEMESPRDGRRLQCTGVVVLCDGSRHAGYAVSMLFTGIDRQTQTQLNQIAFSALA